MPLTGFTPWLDVGVGLRMYNARNIFSVCIVYMNTKFCIHIQTHTQHYAYANNLITSLCKYSNIQQAQIPIFLVFDTLEDQLDFSHKYEQSYEYVSYINIQQIVNSKQVPYVQFEQYDDLCTNSIPHVQWGSGGHRNYVAVKRVYSILAIEQMGYEYIWCFDSESLVVKPFDMYDIIHNTTEKPLLLICKNNDPRAIRYPKVIQQLFRWNYTDQHEIFTIGVRMNDFFMYNTHIFKKMIMELTQVHNSPVSYFINGCEQSLYDYYVFKQYLDKTIDIRLIILEDDLHNNNLFNYVIGNTNIDIDKFCTNMNDTYFNYTLSYRGDFAKLCQRSKRGKDLMDKLNLCIMLSNFQGV